MNYSALFITTLFINTLKPCYNGLGSVTKMKA